ncbi:MAG TPA: hypothetical protein VF049_22285 [Nocardioidaceae bacterium]
MTQPSQAHPPTTGYAVEVYTDGTWIQVTSTYDTLAAAQQQRGRAKKRQPGHPTRIIREVITRTVEDDQ